MTTFAKSFNFYRDILNVIRLRILIPSSIIFHTVNRNEVNFDIFPMLQYDTTHTQIVYTYQFLFVIRTINNTTSVILRKKNINKSIQCLDDPKHV